MSYCLHVDFETRSLLDIKKVGLDRYARSAQPLMMAWAVDDEPVHIWEAHKQPFPVPLRVLIQRPDIRKVAWNANFERMILQFCLGIVSPIEQWIDPAVMSRYAGMPGSLEGVSTFLNLGEQGKLKEGKALMRKFSFPKRKGGFVEPAEALYEWSAFVNYCRQDVIAEREVYNRLKGGFDIFSLPVERQLFDLDAKINERGFPTNLTFVDTAKSLVAGEKGPLVKKLHEITGVEKPGSPKMLVWLRAHGYPFGSLLDKRVKVALANPDLPATVRTVLELRKQASKSSTSKLDAILERASSDSRVRHEFKYYGAHTGRWSANGVQLHNMTRVTVEDYYAAVAAVQSGVVSAVREHGDLMSVVSSVVRAAFQAPDDLMFLIADEDSIENRVLGWLAQCPAIAATHAAGRNPYIEFGAKLFHKAYEAVTKGERQIAKPAVLGCGYAMGGGELKRDKNEDEYKSGLWGYAEQYGVHMTKEKAKEAVTIFRAEYPEVQQLWYNLADAVVRVVQSHTKEQVGCITIGVVPDKVLWVKLPSGRRLHYLRPRLEPGKYNRSVVTFETTLIGKTWGRKTLTGGLLTENLVQAIARDILALGMLRANNAGLEIVAHIHDEIVVLGKPEQLPILVDCMEGPLPWAPDLPTKAAGFTSKVYCK